MYVLDAGSPVTQLRFLSDGRLLVGLWLEATGGVIEVWPLPSGQRVRIPFPDGSWHSGNQIVDHPAGDRFTLAAGRLATYATADGAWIPTPAEAEGDEVIASPTWDELVVAGRVPGESTVLECFAPDGTRRWRAEYPLQAYHHLAGFLPDGRYVVVGHGAVTINTGIGGEENPPLRTKYPSSYVKHPRLSPDGRHLGWSGTAACTSTTPPPSGSRDRSRPGRRSGTSAGSRSTRRGGRWR